MSALESLAPSIAMLGALACLGGGVWTITKRKDRTKGVLMLVMAVVLIGNVLIWTLI